MITKRFLELLAPKETEYLFVCLTERAAKKKVKTYKTEWNYKVEQLLTAHNKAGDAIYISVNAQTGKGRKAEDMLFPRAIFQDDDQSFNGTYPIQPNLIVNTSPGKYQRYWLLDTDHTPWSEKQWDEWVCVQQKLINDYGNDPSVRDSCRLMRLPGFNHLKNTAYPVTFELVHEKRYTWEEILEAFPPQPIKLIPQEKTKAKDHKLLDAMALVKSGENFNDALCTLTMWYIDKKMPADFILLTMQDLMNSSQERGTDRWQERYDHLPRMIEEGMKKKNKETELFKEEDSLFNTTKHSDLPLPKEGTFLRLLVDDIMASMRYPEKNIAILGALHIIGVFAGRQFSYEGMGLVSKRVLLAPPGAGKDSIRKYLSDLSTTLFVAGMKDVYNYTATGSYTTDALMHNDLASWGMRSMIRSEAGFAGKSRAGDQDTLKQYTLQLLSKNHTSGHTPRTQRKKAEDIVDPIFQIALSMLDESVPDSYIEVLRQDDAFMTGDFARIDIVVASGDPTTINKNNTEHKIHPDILARISKFILLSQELNLPRGADFIPAAKSIQVKATEEVEKTRIAFELELLERRRDTRESNPMLNCLLQRRYQKQSVLLLTVALAEYDPIPRDVNHTTLPQITVDHLTWVNEYQDALEETLKSQTRSGTFDGPMARAYLALEDHIKRILSGELKVGNRKMKESNLLTHSEITNNFRQNARFLQFANATCNGDTSRAMWSLLRELEQSGKIEKLSEDDKVEYKEAIKCSPRGTVYKYLYSVPRVKEYL